MPETGVQQVQHRVLGAAHVQVHRHPVLLGLRVHQGAAVAGVDVPQVVPAAARPLRPGTPILGLTRLTANLALCIRSRAMCSVPGMLTLGKGVSRELAVQGHVVRTWQVQPEPATAPQMRCVTMRQES